MKCPSRNSITYCTPGHYGSLCWSSVSRAEPSLRSTLLLPYQIHIKPDIWTLEPLACFSFLSLPQKNIWISQVWHGFYSNSIEIYVTYKIRQYTLPITSSSSGNILFTYLKPGHTVFPVFLSYPTSFCSGDKIGGILKRSKGGKQCALCSNCHL